MTMEEGSDPIRSGFTPPPTDLAMLSSNEANALCLKAAKGAGMSWGLAEEAGYAASWLYARGINGPELLLAHLNTIADCTYDDMRPIGFESMVPCGDHPLCPIALGASLSDHCSIPAGAIGPIDAPVLLVPFLHHLARADRRTIILTWDGGRVSVSPTGCWSGDMEGLLTSNATALMLHAEENSSDVMLANIAPVPISRSILSDLNAYAMQTTVPSSSASREDAGSAAGDND